uniref:Chromo domain-containing protein n=1 Tax=Caenorhabditis tropicalis TaxID=1561998 RepID=A0A1I7T1X5_9PELO
MSDEDSEEFIVEKLLTHLPFEVILQKALDGKARFSPASIQTDSSVHSKWVYLVHWQGFSKEERTWEPEANLMDCVKLKEYKAAHNMSEGHEMFEKEYSPDVGRKMDTANVIGFDYLYTKEELEKKKKEKIRRQMEKLKNLSSKEMKPKPRERMDSPVDIEELIRKKKKAKEAEKRKSLGETSKRENNNFQEFKKQGECLPGIQKLDTKTPRIQKKKSEITDRCDGVPNTSVAGPSNGFERAIQNQKSEETISRPSLKITLKRGPDGFEGVDASSSRSDVSLTTVYSSKEDRNPKEVVEKDTTEIKVSKKKNDSQKSKDLTSKKEEMKQRKKEVDKPKRKHSSVEKVGESQLQKVTRELSKLTTKLKKYPIKVVVPRVVRDHSHAVNLRKFRRCHSEGNLTDFFSRNADLEIFSKNFEAAVIEVDGETPPIIKVYPDEPFLSNSLMDTGRSQARVFENLAQENIGKIKHAMKNMSYDKNFHKLLELLAIAYSKDDSIRFKQIFLNNFPKEPKYDCHRFAAIVFIIAYCNHYQWNADPKLFLIAESDGQQKFGNIRQQEVLCSENHRKCAWMGVFFEVIPERFRFLETSGKCLHGWQGDDGPFRDDVYFHCMKYGAECQKRLFFQYDKPIGIQEEILDEYSLDAMHFLAVQYGNIQRIPSYMAIGGLDINALATNTRTKRVVRLQEYLEEWIEKNVINGSVTDNHKRYYRKLLEMIRLTNESLKFFIETEIKNTFLRRTDGRWKIAMELTHPHILRCSPHNNESIGGDGNQVLSCLFHPIATVGYKDGLETERCEDNKEDMDKLRAAHKKFQKLVSDEKGRLIIALFRTDILFEANVQKKYAVPQFNLIKDNTGFEISRMTLLRQIDTADANLVDIALIEMKMLASPGCRYYCIETSESEKRLVVPGNAHIEVKGEFSEPMTFVTQVFFMKRNF